MHQMRKKVLLERRKMIDYKRAFEIVNEVGAMLIDAKHAMSNCKPLLEGEDLAKALELILNLNSFTSDVEDFEQKLRDKAKK